MYTRLYDPGSSEFIHHIQMTATFAPKPSMSFDKLLELQLHHLHHHNSRVNRRYDGTSPGYYMVYAVLYSD